MPGITGQGTTFALPNYVGDLFATSPQDTPFLSAIGGLSGGKAVYSTLFQWQGYDLRDASASRQRLEGANAPTSELRKRFNISNVVEIHQETVEISYTKLSATGQYASTGSANANSVGIDGTNPVVNEAEWQIKQALIQIARDVELGFLTSTFQNPADNATPRKTRGILPAITTNVIAAAGAPLDRDMVLDLMQEVWGSGGIMVSDTAALICNGWQKRMLTKIFVTDSNYQETTRTIGGVAVTTIITDFGTLNIMLNRYMPTDTIAVVSLEQCQPTFLAVPGKGFLFIEPLGTQGSAQRSQIYGEIGLEYGNEMAHGKITGLDDGTGS